MFKDNDFLKVKKNEEVFKECYWPSSGTAVPYMELAGSSTPKELRICISNVHLLFGRPCYYVAYQGKYYTSYIVYT